jgi:hypothetical protein
MHEDKTKYCINCGIEISKADYEKYNGYCQECYLLLFSWFNLSTGWFRSFIVFLIITFPIIFLIVK